MEPPAAPQPQAKAVWGRWLAGGRGLWLSIFLSVIFGAALLLPDPGPFPVVRLNAFDYYQVLLPRHPRTQPAIIIAVDDASLEAVGQWPWPRDIIARLIDRIAARRPAAIGIDILFTESDRSSPERIGAMLRERDPPLAQRLSAMRSNDDILAATIARAPVVLGLAGTETPTGKTGPMAPSNTIGSMPPLQRYAGMVRSLPVLDASARGHALLNAEPERGIVRRVPLVALADNQPVLTLALESLRVAAGVPAFEVSNAAGVTHIKIGDLDVPAQPDGRAWVHFSPHLPGRYVSALKVLNGEDDPELIEGKIALLGVTALAVHDQHTTPRGERMPGIEIHAQLAENIFEGALLSRPVWARLVEAIVFLFAAALLVMGVPRVGPARSFGLLLACSGVFIGAGFAAYAWGDLLFDPATPIAGITVLDGFMLSATLVATELQRRQLSSRLVAEREAAARVTGELEAARRIQLAMLPTRESALREERRVEIFAYMKAAREVGGDLYDFFTLPDDRLFVLIGDVSGKGLPAAMFMAVSKALAKSCAMRGTIGIAELMTTFNLEISRENPEQNFVTVFALIMDLTTGELEYCNAGHEPPILVRRTGEALILDAGGGPPLCVLDDYIYESARERLEPLDVLALTSDGITEAMNPEGALYGRDRMKALLESPQRRGLDLTVLGNEMLAGVKRFESGAEPSDDQTLLLLSWRRQDFIAPRAA